MKIEDKLYKLSPELDYNTLHFLLRDYKFPRDKISKLIKESRIVRVKKGLYVLGPCFQVPYSEYVLANLIYGPSYVSGNSALSWWQAIPEKITLIQSTTCKRNKRFDTPVGYFDYRYLALPKYQIGVERVQISRNRFFLIACREKSIIEELSFDKQISNESQIEDWLASKRIDSEFLKKLRITELRKVNQVFSCWKSATLINVVRELKKT